MATYDNPRDFSNLGLFVTQMRSDQVPQNATGIRGITALQTLTWDLDIPTENVGSGGRTAVKKVYNQAPTVTLDFSYHTVDFYNERSLGFTIDSTQSFIAGIATRVTDEKNYYAPISDPGVDLEGLTPIDYAVVGFGNGFISSWSTEAAVNGFATTTVSVEASNMCTYVDGVSEAVPTIDNETDSLLAGSFTLPSGLATLSGQPDVIMQGQIVLTVTENAENTPFYNPTGLCLQSYNISVDFNRNPIACLGSRYPRSRKIQFPIDINLTIEALAGDLQTGCLNKVVCDNYGFDFEIDLHSQSCNGEKGPIYAKYFLSNMTFTSMSSNGSQGADQTVTLNYIGSVSASGVVEEKAGMSFSGVYNYISGGTVPQFSN